MREAKGNETAAAIAEDDETQERAYQNMEFVDARQWAANAKLAYDQAQAAAFRRVNDADGFAAQIQQNAITQSQQIVQNAINAANAITNKTLENVFGCDEEKPGKK